MPLKNKIKKLELALNINSKFCSCPNVFYFSFDRLNERLVITKHCVHCGKKVEPVNWAETAIEAEKEIEAESRDKSDWKNYTDEE